jgi:hypothetical protein
MDPGEEFDPLAIVFPEEDSFAVRVVPRPAPDAGGLLGDRSAGRFGERSAGLMDGGPPSLLGDGPASLLGDGPASLLGDGPASLLGDGPGGLLEGRGGAQAPAREAVAQLAARAPREAPVAYPVDALLGPVFRDFEQAGVRWCLLGPPEPVPAVRAGVPDSSRPGGANRARPAPRDGRPATRGSGSASRSSRPGRGGEEVTALVERPAVATAKRILRSHGFAPIPTWEDVPGGSGGQRRGEGAQRYTGYNPKTDCWITLYLVIRLALGPYGAFETGAEGGCLERRRWEGGVYVLGHDDAFWTLLLQLLLDPRDEAAGGGHPLPLAGEVARLERLMVEARTDGPLARMAGSLLPPKWTPEHLVDCVWEGEWDVLARLAPKLEAEWWSRRTWAARRRAWRTRLAHRIATREVMEGFLSAAPGFSVALLAPGLGGKAALARDLGRTFYLPVTHVRMGAPPRPRGRSRRLVRAGFFRTLVTYWHRYLIGRLRQARGRLVIFDRYTYDARIPPATPLPALGRLRRFILGRACPAPDLVAVLDVPVSRSRRSRTAGRGATGAFAGLGSGGALGPAGVPGAGSAEDGSQRRTYLDLAQRIPEAVIVEAPGGDDMLRRELTAQIWRAYAAAPPPAWRRCVRRLRRPWRSGI